MIYTVHHSLHHVFVQSWDHTHPWRMLECQHIRPFLLLLYHHSYLSLARRPSYWRKANRSSN